MNKEIEDLLVMARRWRKWAESQITGANDEFLLGEYEEKIHDWMLPRLRGLTVDDDEYNRYGAEILENWVILYKQIYKKSGWGRLIKWLTS